MKLYDTIPECLLGKYQIIGTVTFTALFTLVALIVSSVFLGGAWFSFAEGSSVMGLTMAFYLAGVAVIAVSRRLMYLLRKTTQYTLFSYVVWCAVEVAIVSGIYLCLTYLGSTNGWIAEKDHNWLALYGNTFLGIAICVGIPYIISGQYFIINDKNNTIRLMNFESVATDTSNTPQDAQKITLCDDSGVIKLVVNSSNLFYIESDDNYVKAWYQDASGDLKQYMLRCRLKTVEDSFLGSDLVRCHRKYIVNMGRAKVVLRRKEGYFVDLGLSSVDPIPISKTYEESVLSIFNSR